ncbi:hypothetical protein E4U43_002878 [Claviceps pusilla]|uniref:RING-type E3 ubiquitin transferase n=1 Tax=Claviceps pusilla TaxID=123648 RepID=A0A9P7NHT8_9HYPO|nr:hypothetical protein E4U43_002878 [Claviceps pusilla]
MEPGPAQDHEADHEADRNLRQLVLQNTLGEVAARPEDAAADCCVICLDIVTEPCEALPCRHRNFDYLCLSNWLFETPQCPLCKARVLKVVHGPTDAPVTTFFDQKKKPAAASSSSSSSSLSLSSSTPTRDSSFSAQSFYTGDHHERRARFLCPRSRPRRFREQSRPATATVVADAVEIRRNVYRHRRYSKHVGSNRLSRYRELTPHMFCTDAELVSRARMWMRRELGVFSFLSLDGCDDDRTSSPFDGSSRCGTEAQQQQQQRRRRRRAMNAEFLLEYIVAILKSVDIMGSGGQAEEMLSEFLGRDNTRLFLHELRAWLRSPYTKLEDWDRAVQYDGNISQAAAAAAAGAGTGSASRDEAAAPRRGERGDSARERGLSGYDGQGVRRQMADYYRPGRGESFIARKKYEFGGKKPSRRRSRSPERGA